MKKVIVSLVATVFLHLFCYSDFALARGAASDDFGNRLDGLANSIYVDLDNDGDHDLVEINNGYIRYFEMLSTGEIVRRNEANGPFKIFIPALVDEEGSMRLHDFDNDGDLDLHIKDGHINQIFWNTGTMHEPLFETPGEWAERYIDRCGSGAFNDCA